MLGSYIEHSDLPLSQQDKGFVSHDSQIFLAKGVIVTLASVGFLFCFVFLEAETDLILKSKERKNLESVASAR